MKYRLHTSYQLEEPSLTESSYRTRGTRCNLAYDVVSKLSGNCVSVNVVCSAFINLHLSFQLSIAGGTNGNATPISLSRSQWEFDEVITVEPKLP